MSFTRQRFEPGLSNVLPFDSSSLSLRPAWWFLIANTAPSSLLISKYFSPLGVSLKISMCFFESYWFFTTSLSKEKTDKKTRLFAALCVVEVSQCQQAHLRKVWQRLHLSGVACALLELFDRSC